MSDFNEIDRLCQEIAELKETNRCLVDQASCWYGESGVITRMDPSDVIEKRKAAGQEIANLKNQVTQARDELGSMREVATSHQGQTFWRDRIDDALRRIFVRGDGS